MQRIYEALGGAEWAVNDNWVPGESCQVPHHNRFFGTWCQYGYISLLELRLNNVSGAVPTELGELPSLETLRLDGNPLLSGTLPTELGAMTSLRVLALGNNTISGSIPDELLKLKKLVFLDLQQNFISGTLPQSKTHRWPELVHMKLGDNRISGSLPPFTELETLGYFNVQRNAFSGTLPSEVALLTNLRDRLHASSNRVSGTLPTQLGAMIHVPLPALHYNSFEGFLPSELGKVQMLGFPAFSYNRLSGTTPTELLIGDWRTLEARLDIASNRMFDHCWNFRCWSWADRRPETDRDVIEQAIIDRNIIGRQLTEKKPITWWDGFERCTKRAQSYGKFRCSAASWHGPPPWEKESV